MDALHSGFTALRATQAGIDVTAQNLANASTEGYHRRDVVLRERILVSEQTGYGVDIESIRRIRSTATEGLITGNISAAGFSSAQLQTLEQLETLVTPGDGSIHDRIQSFFGALHDLSARSDDTALQRLVVERGAQLAAGIRSMSVEVSRIRTELDNQIRATVREVNEINAELTDVHGVLLRSQSGTEPSNSLLDRYDVLVNRLAEFVDARPDIENNRHHVVRFASGQGLVGQQHRDLEVTYESGAAAIQYVGGDADLAIGSGRLGGLLVARNQLLDGFDARLQEFTQDLVTAVDSIHSTGLGLSGEFETLSGARSVVDVDATLSVSSPDFPIQDGAIHIGVLDKTSGIRTLHRIDIDPDSDSLRDVAAQISGIPELHAFVSDELGTLTLAATPGFAFDFTGRPETEPDPSAITGSSRLTLSGLYTGASNGTFQFDIASSGTVGVTESFFVDVRDQAGNLVNRLSIGEGYEPGSKLEAADGVFVAFSAGTFNAGDSATSDFVSNPDETGLLVALGLNTFFHGSKPHSIEVNNGLVGDPRQFASSFSGLSSDTRNLNQLLKIRDLPVAMGNTRTLEKSITDLTAQVGTQVGSERVVFDGITLTGEQLVSQRESVSGVDPNEELVRMMTYQRSFQAASRVIATVDSNFEDLLAMI